jgi:hypothetical protein
MPTSRENNEGPDADRLRKLAKNRRRRAKEERSDEPVAGPMDQMDTSGDFPPRAEKPGRQRIKAHGHDESYTGLVPPGDGVFIGDDWVLRRRPTPQLPLTGTQGRATPRLEVRRRMCSPTLAGFLRGVKLVFYQQEVAPDGIVRWALASGWPDASGEVQWDCSDCDGVGIGSVCDDPLRAPRCPNCYAVAYL